MMGDAVFGLAGAPSRRSTFLLWSVARPALERLLGLAALERRYRRRPPECRGSAFLDWALEQLDIEVCSRSAELERVPASGAAVVVANHPFGGVEGLALARLLLSRRPDVKVMANYLLGRIPETRELFLLVDPFGGRDAVRRNLAATREAVRWLASGGMLAVFPAGEVAHLDPRTRRVEEPAWNPAVAGLVRRAGCPAVPVYFHGRNRLVFQLLGLVHPRLRTALLARELLARRGSTIEVRIGSPVPARQLDCASDRDAIAYLCSRSAILAERADAVQPRATPADARPIIPPVPVELLLAELARLPASALLVDGDDQVVYCAEPSRIPAVLREIGRLRELTFREVGEGTGREVDLDDFDTSYLHLFVWSRADRRIVGAYRLGLVDRLVGERGLAGLYTSTLFDFEPRLFETLGPALEMGRSFVQPDYQKSYAGLMLLWKGIGEFVVRHPRYATLFGPVSISAEYRSASQRLIVAFLERNRYAHEGAAWVRPRTPHRPDKRTSRRLSPLELRDLDDVSSFIAEIEADQKGVPILLRQYLKLGGRLLGFNVDPDFSNVLDVLILVDLRRTDPRILARYMGRRGVAAFLAHHHASRAAAS